MSNVLLVGKPNCGKSLLFNRLTGLQQKVANFPGATVEVKKGQIENQQIIDLPGVYSLNPLSQDEVIATKNIKEAITDSNTKTLVFVVDVNRLERSLNLVIQVLEIAQRSSLRIVVALNMIDEVLGQNKISIKSLEENLGIKVIAVSAKKSTGLDKLKAFITGNESPKKYEQPAKTARSITQEFLAENPGMVKLGNELDSIFLSSFLGGLFFLVIMAFLFQSIFTWADPIMGLIEEIIAYLAVTTTAYLGDGIIKDFINDALFGGFGSFVVFVPQIFILTFLIGVLEDSGYLARAAIICHRIFSIFGLTGKSFIPYLSGHACSIPAIMAARTIESKKQRLITILTIPLTVCSARLPVYALLVTILIPATPYLGGLITAQGLTFFALYGFGLGMALIASGLLSKFLSSEKDIPFILELPAYRIPNFTALIRRSLTSTWFFLKEAGPIIFTVTVVVWILGYFPNGAENLQSSWLASLGKFIEPLFTPMGLDWRYGVAILVSFLAREVFVGTLGTFYSIEGADENITGLANQVQADGLSMASGGALLIFYAIALQCISTVAVIKKELGSQKLAALAFAAYNGVAYLIAILFYQIFA